MVIYLHQQQAGYFSYNMPTLCVEEIHLKYW